MSKIYFPNFNSSFDHPKLRVRIGDGVEFLRNCAKRARAVEAGEAFEDSMDPDMPIDGKFDVIITDSSEMDKPDSPNEALFQKEYFQNLHDVLRAPNGILSSLGVHSNYYNIPLFICSV